MTPAAPAGQVAGAVARVRERVARACERAGRDPDGITVVAVTKTRPPADVVAAWEAGIREFGENRVQEALPKIEAVREMLGALPPGAAPAWRLIGHLQTNKAKAAAAAFDAIDTVDSVRAAEAVAAGVTGGVLPVMLQVNVSGEASKAGVAPAGLAALLAHVRGLPSLSVRGLMTVAPRAADPEEARPAFAALRRLAREHGLAQLSMGMTEDFETAIAEGATHVRIGRAIFGERQV